MAEPVNGSSGQIFGKQLKFWAVFFKLDGKI